MNITGFNAAPDAVPSFKERALWALTVGLFFFLVYGTTNQISALTGPHPAFFFEWEQSIPFIPELIVPYMSSDVFFVVAFAMAPTRNSIQKLGLRCGLAILLSAVFFLLIPLQFKFIRPEVTGWTSFLFDWLSLDQPYNQFPSLHISLGFITWHLVRSQLRWIWRIPLTLWFLAIVASTVCVYQHHFIDIIGGIAAIIAVYIAIPKKGRGFIPLWFVSPRHLHMAFRYLIASALLTIAAFTFENARLPLGWIALSLVLVAVSYTLGFNRFLIKSQRSHSLIAWVLFGPFLIGSWINWRFWRSRIPLDTEIEPGLWMGARPGRADWKGLEMRKIDSVIDLAPELWATTPEGITHYHHPLLDIAIPAPETLNEIAIKIEEFRKQGNVYIHCALGMSRSAMAIAAWMIRQGASVEEALARLDIIRPERVRKPYINITLELYADHLRKVKG